MVLSQTKASFDAAATAAGLVMNVDVASQATGQGVDVMPLSMLGLKYLRWVLRCDVPSTDIAILQLNMFAAKNGLAVAWPQT